MAKSLSEILEGLPELDFTGNIEAQDIEADMIDDYNAFMSDALDMDYDLPVGDPMRCLIEACTDIFAQIVNVIDNDAKQNFLKYAYGENLDNLGLLKGVTRKGPEPATVTMQFSTEDQPTQDIVIPAGTEVAASDDVYFATDEDCTITAAVRASTTLTVTITAQDNAVTIPAGTTVMDDDEAVIFRTTDPLTIAAGSTSGTVNAVADEPGTIENGHANGTFTKFGITVAGLSKISNTTTSGGVDSDGSATVTATCEDDGTIGNGYLAGSITDMIDDVEGVDSCTNIDESATGTDTESDDELRERIYNAPAMYSVAGPTLAYKYLVEEYSDDIQDVSVVSPSDGEVDVYFILTDGVLPGDTAITEISEYLSSDNIRPLTDKVVVKAPTTVTYNITVTYHIRKSDAKSEETIKGDVEDALEQYQTWQGGAIGRSIDPGQLTTYLREVGAVQITVTAPTITAVSSTQVAVAGEVNMTYGGLIDD